MNQEEIEKTEERMEIHLKECQLILAKIKAADKWQLVHLKECQVIPELRDQVRHKRLLHHRSLMEWECRTGNT